MKPRAVFLDRDGVINCERGEHTFRREDFIFNEGIFSSLKKLQEQGFLLIIITNQSGIAKEIYTHGDVEKLHTWMNEQLKEQGIIITNIYYCPHHPVRSKCLCRKPGALLLEKAIAHYGIDPAKSFFIGDAARDEEAGKKAGVKTFRIAPNQTIEETVSRIIHEMK